MKDAPKLYLARAGRNGEDEDLGLESNLAIIEFRDIPSLEGAADYNAIVELVSEALPDQKPRRQLNFARQLLAFAVTMQTGDLVILPRKLTSQIAIGQVSGPYRFRKVNSETRHTRPVEWLQTDIPRTTFEQDLLHSFGAFMTVCNISRNDAARRVTAVLEGKRDPGSSVPKGTKTKKPPPVDDQAEAVPDLVQMAHDQIVARIQSRFSGHALTRLVDAVLQEGFNRAVLQESKQSHFTVRLWNSSDLVGTIYRNYDRLPAEVQAELPLKQVWMLVSEDSDE